MDELFESHVRSRKQGVLNDCVETGVMFEPYGQNRKTMSPAEESAAKNVFGTLDEPPGVRKDYQDSIRVVHFRNCGHSDQKIAERLRLPAEFVKSCRAPDKLPVPKQVPKYIADHGLRCLEGGIEPFRPAELRRAFVQSSGAVLRALSSSLSWVAAPALKRDYDTGEVWDTGHRLLREKASCCLRTGVPVVDAAIASIIEEYEIDDPGAYLLCNRYKDGRAFIAPHQHDFWSATFSFGASRVFILDQMDLILQDGDVLIFGSQKHSVPKMPNSIGERISLSLFWYPNWRSYCSYTEEQLNQWQMESEAEALWAAQRASSVDMLSQLGFNLDVIVPALNHYSDDFDAAMDTLLTTSDRPDECKDTVCVSGDPTTKPDVPDATETADRPKSRWRHHRRSS